MIKLNGEPLDFKKFNDGTLRFTLYPWQDGEYKITWLYCTEDELSQLYFLVCHLRNYDPHIPISLNMPYVPNARLDRVKNDGECFTLKYFCDFINSMNFSYVKIFDPHSNVAAALLDRVVVEKPTNELLYLNSLHSQAILFFPDEGSLKRWKDHISYLPFAFGVKDRDWLSQNINSLYVLGAKDMIESRDILIMDDILSRGSTLYLSASQLKQMGANNIYVYISHTENTVLSPHINGRSVLDIPDLITTVYTTNSIWTGSHDKVKVIHEF